jgi:UDP-hydrolysing UDP-N-acetyl-D-glucosamine 2-epimerase
MRKICAVLTSRAHYGRMKYTLLALRDDPEVELQVVIGGAALSETYGSILHDLERDGIPVHYKVLMLLEGGSPQTMAKTTAIGLLELSSVFEAMKPDIVLVRGDRFETMAPVIAAVYMNIMVAHIEGGDVSGTVDEIVRHSITKLSHLHLTTNEDAFQRVLRLGEEPSTVHLVGSPDIEFIARNKKHIDTLPTHIFKKDYPIGGVGQPIDPNKPYLVVLQHPVTTEYGDGKAHMDELVAAIKQLRMPTVFFWPNVDAGTDEISKAIRLFINNDDPDYVYFLKNIPPEDFLALVNHAACLVGNSSAGMKESTFLGTPVVNIGTRQQGRLRGKNVVDADYDATTIITTIKKQVAHGKYTPEYLFGEGDTAARIVQILKTTPLLKQKRITY